MNLSITSGRLTADPKVHVFESGAKVVKFTIADNGYTKKNGETKTEFFNMEAWGKTADLVEKFLKKGRYVTAFSRYESEKYTKDGVNVTYPKWTVDRIEFGPDGTKTTTESHHVATTDDTDDIPF